MDDTQWDKEEPLAEGLETVPEEVFQFPKSSEAFRKSLFDRTEKVLRARARRRGLVYLVVVAAAYLGGITTTFFIADKPDIWNGQKAVFVKTSPEQRAGASLPDEFFAEPGELVRKSEGAAPREQTQLLTQAGDLYLSKQYDVEKALYCYSQALNAMPAQEQTQVKPDDTWLLAALKDSRK